MRRIPAFSFWGFLLGVAVLAVRAGVTPPPAYELNRSTLSAGGTASGGDFEMTHTIGIPGSPPASGGDFDLTGGFWFQSPPGDCDPDGAISLTDISPLPDCLTGPMALELSTECLCIDVNIDSAIDLRDFAALQTSFNGE